MMRLASRAKHASFSASSQTVRHASGTSTGAHAPVALSPAPMRRFHPPLKLTRAHACMRAQFRIVHGAHTASAMAVAMAAARARAQPKGFPPTPIHPKHTARTRDCGRTSVASPRTTPTRMTPARDRSAAIHAATATSAAVTPSVMRAGVYMTRPGWSATASPPASAHRGRAQGNHDFANRKPPDVGVRSFDAAHGEGAYSLNRVRSRLVGSLARCDVPIDLDGVEPAKFDARGHRFGVEHGRRRGDADREAGA